MLRKIVSSAPGIWKATYGHGSAARALEQELSTLPARPIKPEPIATQPGVHLHEIDRRPGSQINLIVHGCGVSDDEATLIRRKVREAGLSGVTYLLRWETPDIEVEAAKEGFLGLHRAGQLAISNPTTLGLTVAAGMAIYSTLSGFKSGGFAAYYDGLRSARNIANELDSVLDAIPEMTEGKKVNVVAHSMGAGLVSFALENDEIASKINDVVLMGSVAEETELAPGRTINVFSRDDQALAHLGETLGNGKLDNEDLEHRELECGHHGYWSRLRSVVPRSWRAPLDVSGPNRRRLPPHHGQRCNGMRPHEVRLYQDAA